MAKSDTAGRDLKDRFAVTDLKEFSFFSLDEDGDEGEDGSSDEGVAEAMAELFAEPAHDDDAARYDVMADILGGLFGDEALTLFDEPEKFGEHDVSGEARDAAGKWTKGGSDESEDESAMSQEIEDGTQDIDPASITPPHGIRDKDSLKKITESMKEHGWQGRPVLAIEIGENEYKGWTGSHRTVAAQKAGLDDIPTFVVSFDDFLNGVKQSGRDESEVYDLLEGNSDDDDKKQLLEELGLNAAADLMRQEIDAAEESEDFMEKFWEEAQHPRGKAGKFIEKHSAEARQAARDAVGRILKGERTAETHKALVEHLGLLTVAQLHELKKEYGLSASAGLKEQLVAKLADRLGRGRHEQPEKEKPKAYWRDELKGKKRYEAVEVLRKQPAYQLTFEEYQNLRDFDMTDAEQKKYQTWKTVKGKSVVDGDATHAKQQEAFRAEYEQAIETAYLAGKPTADKPAWAKKAGDYLGDEDDPEYRVKAHKPHVAAALAAGKPVPPEVLADYPDLKPQPALPPNVITQEQADQADAVEAKLKRGEKLTPEESLAVARLPQGQRERLLKVAMKAQAWKAKATAPAKPITNHKDAAKVCAQSVMDGLWTSEAMKRYEKENPGEIPTVEQIEKNWAKVFRSKKMHKGKSAFQDLDPEVGKNIQGAIDDNHTNQAFQAVVKKFGSMPIVFRNREDEDSAAAEYRGGVIHIYSSPWQIAKVTSDGPIGPETEGTWNQGGLSAVLRHEYGHGVYDRLPEEKQKEWVKLYHQNSEAWKKDLTEYSASKPQEAFPEALAVMTDRNFKEENYPPSAQRAFAFLKGVI